MNSCILMAEIIREPQLRYTPDTQTAVTEMMVQFPGLRAEDPPATVKVVGWGNLAQEIQGSFKKGDRVILEGRLTMNTIDRQEGFKEKRAELTVSRIHKVAIDTDFDTSVAESAPPSNVVPMGSRRPSSAPADDSDGGMSGDFPTEETPPSRVPTRTGSRSTPPPQGDIDDIPF
ncbi:single-stranded DNA-binding protein [Coleofasciculus sp. FACHB-64]|uniref:single-stranded DNA-binding protein n=1 Tax=Cyanophyceae TaxID=3028117 RepID=UPI0016833374|nr:MULTISPECIES: single-stranded DNA-binding protein [unclassified Coleofasciculus]MBD1836677.1 single-stranded DNA-binding protein [Coleofasciculus sp. FACHB-501]MBD1880207.1 single-stranded DNA-binding protein [Coleofasciculus sp. FACHB-T130]MBD2047937.1 single-stranded DNA-binding protein [Coleofasciculus sp. FACHB-64]MBD2083542.1 single-stranded DNA-binding protein [Coleofasciculus sp. FACHB-542]MBD2538477.1 single-stranded DNA-binding protein [Coleofasciculus sp. FACHB-SPT36]